MQQGGGSDMMTWNRGMYDSTNNIMVMSNSVGGSTSHLLTAMQLAPVPVPAIVGSGIKRGFSSVYGSGNEAEAENGTGLAFKKKRLSSEQVKVLESSFEVENKLEAEKKAELAKELGLQPRQVAVWFQNRRARSKTKRLEFSFDSLRDRYDAVLEERDRLRTEVVHLTAMLAQVKDGNQHDTEENNNDTFPVEQKANLEQNSNLMVGFIGEKGSPGTSDYSHISDPAASIQRPISSSSPCHCDSSPPKLNQLPTTLPTAAARGAGDEELDFADEPFANLFPITGDVQNEMMMWLW